MWKAIFLNNLKKLDKNYQMSDGRPYALGCADDIELCNIFQNKLNDKERGEVSAHINGTFKWTRIYKIVDAFRDLGAGV